MSANSKYGYTRLTTGTTIINKGKAVVLVAININKALTGTVTLTDGATTVAVITNGTTAPLGTVLFGPNGGISLQNLTVALSATEDVTIIWE